VRASSTTSSTTTTPRRDGSAGHRRGRRWGRAAATTAALCLVLAGCSSAPDTAPSVTSPAPSTSAAATPATGASPSVAADALRIDVTIAGGDVSPNGQKLDVRVGQQVVVAVTSDQDDEIHAHTGGDGVEIEVKAGQPTSGSFTLDSPGSFEVESHHLGKVVVILEAR